MLHFSLKLIQFLFSGTDIYYKICFIEKIAGLVISLLKAYTLLFLPFPRKEAGFYGFGSQCPNSILLIVILWLSLKENIN